MLKKYEDRKGFGSRAVLTAGLVMACMSLAMARANAQAPTAQAAPSQAAATQSDATPAQPPAPQTEMFALRMQATATEQATFKFPSAYQGPQSLVSGNYGRETSDVTGFIGVGGLPGFEFWVNPEIDQGYGLSSGHGVAGIPNGEAARINASTPYVKIPFAFVRQTFNLGGEVEQVSPDQNQLAHMTTANRVMVTVGKLSVASIFDANSFAHDPRGDFFNGDMMDTASFDYAGNANTETYGAVVEWRQSFWTARLGAFDMAASPGNRDLDAKFGQVQTVGELELRNSWWKRTGKIVFTGFYDRARFAAFSDIVAAGPVTAATDLSGFRRYRSKAGFAANGEEQLIGDLSGFFRAGFQDGRYESFGFTDVDRTAAAGLSLAGGAWKRPNDKVALAFAVNEASRDRLAFLNDGGQGLMLGDGRLTRSGPEQIVETYYAVAIRSNLILTFDAQMVANPGYNRDRGPAPIIGLRLHFQR